jgi:hypothetical protein
VIVKHTNPCGVASRGDLLEAYRLAVVADPISAFGGIVAFNRPVDEALAREIREYRWGMRARTAHTPSHTHTHTHTQTAHTAHTHTQHTHTHTHTHNHNH